MSCMIFVFKQKTAYDVRISDWSSDVCSSDLRLGWTRSAGTPGRGVAGCADADLVAGLATVGACARQSACAGDRAGTGVGVDAAGSKAIGRFGRSGACAEQRCTVTAGPG